MIDESQYKIEIGNEELEYFLQSVFDKYGYDFRSYSQAHIKRRITNRISMSRLHSLEDLQSKILTSTSFASLFIKDLSINVTEMYRDPNFYAAVREKVIPRLKTYSFLKTWHAGCATGEEVYSMAILLTEENLYDRSLIYATDFNQQVLDTAKAGIYSEQKTKQYTRNHQLAGGNTSLSDYYIAKYDKIIMDKSLKKNIVWAHHNLVTDSAFAEVQLILCRNVLIYFNQDLQNKVLELFHESLAKGGYLCLGARESLRFSSVADRYQVVDSKNKIYIKKY
jgi:chemotaxis protein methyltransferase CheR